MLCRDPCSNSSAACHAAHICSSKKPQNSADTPSTVTIMLCIDTHAPATLLFAADQCTYDYKGIGVCVEGVDDGCLLAGASMLRGNTLTCLSASSECRAEGLGSRPSLLLV
jgi:hypothetical protein